MFTGPIRLHALAAVTLATVCPHPAHADAIDSCTSALVGGQRNQQRGKLQDARVDFLACIRPECPAEVRSVCDGLLSALDRKMPTVILGARASDGQDLLAVRVLVDGAPLLESLDGKPVPIDPGPHALRFEHEGSPAVDLQVVVRETEKDRVLSVTVARAPLAEPPPPAPRGARPTPMLVYVLGGTGLAFLGGFTYLAAHGQSQYDQCDPHGCSQSTVNGLAVERDLAFGALGLGVVSLGAAAAIWLTRPTAPGPSARGAWLSVAPTVGGGRLRLDF